MILKEIEESIHKILRTHISNDEYRGTKGKASFKLLSDYQEIAEQPNIVTYEIEKDKCYLSYNSETWEYIIYLEPELMSIDKIPMIRYVYSLDLTGINFKNIARNIINNRISEIKTNKHIKELIIHNTVFTSCNIDGWFSEFKYLKKLDVSGCSFPLASSAKEFLENNTELEEIDLTDVDMSNVESIQSFFKNCYSLYKIDVSFLSKCKGLTDISNLFENCRSLYGILGINDIDVSHCKLICNAFANCTSLTDLDLGNWEPDRCYAFDYLFFNCSNLQRLDIHNFKFGLHQYTEEVSHYNMFNFDKNNLIGKDIDLKVTKVQITDLGLQEAHELIDTYAVNYWLEAKYNIFKPYIIDKDRDNLFNDTIDDYVRGISTNYDSKVIINNTKISEVNWEKTKEKLEIKSNMLGIGYFDLGFTFGTMIEDSTGIKVETFSI